MEYEVKTEFFFGAYKIAKVQIEQDTATLSVFGSVTMEPFEQSELEVRKNEVIARVEDNGFSNVAIHNIELGEHIVSKEPVIRFNLTASRTVPVKVAERVIATDTRRVDIKQEQERIEEEIKALEEKKTHF